jgi:hypothetical protein
MVEGLTRTLFPKNDSDLQCGICILARAFVARMDPRHRPGGIRDVGFGLIEGIQKSNNTQLGEETINVLTRLLNKIVDGTSVLHPWRAENA